MRLYRRRAWLVAAAARLLVARVAHGGVEAEAGLDTGLFFIVCP